VAIGLRLHTVGACCTLVERSGKTRQRRRPEGLGRRQNIEGHFCAENVRTIAGSHPDHLWQAPGTRPYAARAERANLGEPAGWLVQSRGVHESKDGIMRSGPDPEGDHNGRAAVPVGLAMRASQPVRSGGAERETCPALSTAAESVS
jgi:hypothetical protein